MKKFTWTLVAIGAAIFLFVRANEKVGGSAQGGPAGRIVTYTDTGYEEVASFASGFYDVSASRTLAMTVHVTAAVGVGASCACIIETSTDRINWFPTGRAFVSTFAFPGSETIPITKGYKDEVADVEGWFHRYVRANCTIGGTTPFYAVAFYVTGSP